MLGTLYRVITEYMDRKCLIKDFRVKVIKELLERLRPNDIDELLKEPKK